MKPYFGILVDSFREAVNSRVLWALLICWSLLLIGLAPFGYITEQSFNFSTADISSRSRLVEKLAESANGSGKPAAKRVIEELDEQFLNKVREAAKEDSNVRISSQDLAKELDKVISSVKLYDKDVFPSAGNRQELEDLTDQPIENLNEEELSKLNRHLLWLSFPLAISKPRGEALWFGYAGLKIGNPIPLSRKQLGEFIEPAVLQFVIKIGLGMLAILIAIVVTSNIIPETFKSGSLHLLLSKPISRIGLYLSKFFGGTIFVLVNLAFVLVGLYLIAGIRFQIWNEGLLWCIPILLFVFTIFYAVSGAVGLIWGNAIICVVACLVFWFGCTLIGLVRGFCYTPAELNPQINRIRPIDDYLAVVTQKGELKIWNKEFSVWQPATDIEDYAEQYRTFGPIYDAQRKRVLVKNFAELPMRGPYARTREMNVISLGGVSQSPVEDEAPPPEAETPAPASEVAEEETQSNESTDLDEATPESTSPQVATAPETDPLFGALDALDEGPLSDLSSDLVDDSAQQAEPTEEQYPATEKPNPDAADTLEDTPESTDTASEEPNDAETDSAADTDSDLEADAETDGAGVRNAADARSKPAWSSVPGPALPQQLFDIVEVNDRVIAVCRGGLYELDLGKVGSPKIESGGLGGFFGLDRLVGKSAFEDISPPGYFLAENSRAAALADGSGLVIYSSGDVDVLKFDGDKLVVSQKATPEFENADAKVAAVIQMNDQFCVIARNGAPIQLLDNKLNPISIIELPSDEDTRALQWIPGTSRMAITTQAGQLLELNCESQEITSIAYPLSAPVTSMLWEDEQIVWLGVEPNAVYKVDLGTQEIQESYVPEKSTFESIYYWAILPIYEVFPKPAALDDAMTYVLTSKKTQALNIVTNNLETTQRKLEIWKPVLSNLAFLVVVLGISSIYVARKEY